MNTLTLVCVLVSYLQTVSSASVSPPPVSTWLVQILIVMCTSKIRYVLEASRRVLAPIKSFEDILAWAASKTHGTVESITQND